MARTRYIPNPGGFGRFWTVGEGGQWGRQLARQAEAASRRVLRAKPVPPNGPWPRSGRLAASIRHEMHGNQFGTGFRLGAGTGLTYAYYVHEGTTGPIHANGKWMPVGRTQGFDPPLYFALDVAGQPRYPYLVRGLNIALARHGLGPVRGG